jgi:Metallophosphoesterase, calcineurin superfamily
MKRFFVCGGLLGCDAALDELCRMVNERRPDGLLFAGGILAPDRSADDTLFMRQFFAALGELDVFAAVLPGPFDTPVEDFLRLGMDAELDYPNIHLAHANLIALDGMAVCGIGGSLVEENRAEPDMLTRLQADYYLRSLDRADHARKILLLPASPPSLGGGAEGRLIDDLIRGHSADLCVVAGSTMHRGIKRSARTLIVNPGCLADGSAAWVDWRRHPGGHVEFLGHQGAHRPERMIEKPVLQS